MSVIQTAPLERGLWLVIDVFKERLKELRIARGLSQARVAELLEVSPRVYHRWESGQAIPRLETAAKIADILGVSIDELIGREPVSADIHVKNPRLHSLYHEIDALSDADQDALAILLDALVKRSKLDQLLAK